MAASELSYVLRGGNRIWNISFSLETVFQLDLKESPRQLAWRPSAKRNEKDVIY